MNATPRIRRTEDTLGCMILREVASYVRDDQRELKPFCLMHCHHGKIRSRDMRHDLLIHVDFLCCQRFKDSSYHCGDRCIVPLPLTVKNH